MARKKKEDTMGKSTDAVTLGSADEVGKSTVLVFDGRTDKSEPIFGNDVKLTIDTFLSVSNFIAATQAGFRYAMKQRDGKDLEYTLAEWKELADKFYFNPADDFIAKKV